MLIWHNSHELHRVEGGKEQRFECDKCKKKTMFQECRSDESLKANHVVELWSKQRRVMQCGECLGLCDYYEVYPDEKPDENDQPSESAGGDLAEPPAVAVPEPVAAAGGSTRKSTASPSTGTNKQTQKAEGKKSDGSNRKKDSGEKSSSTSKRKK